MSRKKSTGHKRPKRIPARNDIQKKRWMLIIDSKEAAVNFYSILLAFQRSNGGGLINKEALQFVAKWLNAISRRIPDIEKQADNSHGPFRERDTSPLSISLELDYKERALMLFIWKNMYSQLITPKARDNWVKNQGQEDYELAVKNYEFWVNALEGEGYIPTPR